MKRHFLFLGFVLIIGCSNSVKEEGCENNEQNPLVNNWSMVYYDQLDTNMNIVAHLIIGESSSIDYWSLKFYADNTGCGKWYAGLLIEEYTFTWEVSDKSGKDSSLIFISSENDSSYAKYYFKGDSLMIHESYRFYCFLAE